MKTVMEFYGNITSLWILMRIMSFFDLY